MAGVAVDSVEDVKVSLCSELLLIAREHAAMRHGKRCGRLPRSSGGGAGCAIFYTCKWCGTPPDCLSVPKLALAT